MPNRPSLFGNHPTEPQAKRPTQIRGDLIVPFIYPPNILEHSDLNRLFASTDLLTVATYQLAPGGMFAPPDLHWGDEIYYILDGTVTQQNPETGEFAQATKGESLILPQGAWHTAHNFGSTIARMLFVIAPKIWEGQTPPIWENGQPRAYKLRGDVPERAQDQWTWPTFGTVDDIGRWPRPGEELRENPPHYYRVTEERKLVTVQGKTNFMLMKFFVSNDHVHMGEFILPAGGPGPRFSEPDSHGGDCVLFVEEGPLSVYLPNTDETYRVESEEAMYLPIGTRYQLANYNATRTKAIFCIAPNL